MNSECHVKLSHKDDTQFRLLLSFKYLFYSAMNALIVIIIITIIKFFVFNINCLHIHKELNHT